MSHSCLKKNIKFFDLAVTANTEQVELGGVPPNTPHLKYEKGGREDSQVKRAILRK